MPASSRQSTVLLFRPLDTVTANSSLSTVASAQNWSWVAGLVGSHVRTTGSTIRPLMPPAAFHWSK